MSEQSRDKKAAIHNESLRKRSRNICHALAFVLYLVFMISTYGSGYIFFILAPIQTAIFLAAYAVIYVPARACVERFLDRSLSKKKRYAFLLFVLIPYILAIGFCTYMFFDYYFYSISPEYAPIMA